VLNKVQKIKKSPFNSNDGATFIYKSTIDFENTGYYYFAATGAFQGINRGQRAFSGYKEVEEPSKYPEKRPIM
jgi:hypothetical protein